MSSILYHRFCLECIVTDGKLLRTFLDHQPTIMSMIKKFIDPSVIPLAMAAKLNKSKIFQLCFGAFGSTTNNRCEIIITNIFDDTTNKNIHPLETPLT
jgi:replication factor A1